MSITTNRPDTTTNRPDTTTTAPAVRPRRGPRRALLGWAAVGAACLAAGALAVATLSGGGDASPVPAHPGIIANGSPRAIEGSVEDVATVPGGSGLADHGTPRAVDGSVEDRPTDGADQGPPSATVSRMTPPL